MRLIVLCFAVICLLTVANASQLSPAETHRAVFEGLNKVHQTILSLTSTVYDRAQVDFGSSHEQIVSVHELARDVHAAAYHTLGTPTPTCAAALVTLNTTIYSSACQNILTLFANNPFTDLAQLVAAIPTVCANSCLQTLATASAAVATGCQSTDAAFLNAQVVQVISYSTLLCTKDPANTNNYCFIEFVNAFSTIAASTTSPTNAQLAAFCIPCTYTILNGFISYGAISAGAAVNLTSVSLFCSIDSVTGQYCIPELATAATTFESLFKLTTTIPQVTNAQFEPLCSSCTKKFVAATGNPAVAAELGALCVMNGNDFCLIKNLNNLQAFVNVLTTAGGAVCPAFSAYVSAVGCCITPFNAVLNSVQSPLSFNTYFALCNSTAPPGTCPVPSYTGSFTFVILNLAYSYYQANNATVNAAIVADLTLNLGVTAAQITITGVVGTTAGVQVTVTINFVSTLATTTTIGQFTSNIKVGNFPLANTAQLGPVSRIAPVSPVAMSTTGASASSNAPTFTTASPIASPAAQQASASVMLLAIPILALLFSKN
jgi:hypothetical protein